MSDMTLLPTGGFGGDAGAAGIGGAVGGLIGSWFGNGFGRGGWVVPTMALVLRLA